jgi:hypothetical protein
MCLEVKPSTGARAEITGKAQGCVNCNGAMSPYNLAHAHRGDAKSLGERILSKTQGLHKIVQQDLARMNRRQFLCFRNLKRVRN